MFQCRQKLYIVTYHLLQICQHCHTANTQAHCIPQWLSREHTDINVRFQVLMVLSMKMIAFSDIALCSLVEVDQHFRGVYYLAHCPDDGGSTYLWKVGLLERDYTALYPRRLSSSEINIFIFITTKSQQSLSWLWISLKVHYHVQNSMSLETIPKPNKSSSHPDILFL
jgi:hypothetical protein